MLCCESSKKISAPKASRNGPLWRPPRNSASSRRTPHSRNVRITRSCAGAERAVTSAVRIGDASPGGTAAARHAVPTGNCGKARPTTARVRVRARDARSFHALLARDALALVAEDHRVAIEAIRSCVDSRLSSLSAIAAAASARSPGARGMMVAAAMPWLSARRTDSGLADRNRSVPNGLTYGQVGWPEVNVHVRCPGCNAGSS